MPAIDYVGKTIENNKFGPFTILANATLPSGGKGLLIQFANTNSYNFNTYRVISRANIKQYPYNCSIRDPYSFNSYDGYSCHGMIPDVDVISSLPEYQKWYDMIRRCYMESNNCYPTYGAKGVTVCYRWRCFQYFLEDVVKLPNYDAWKAEGHYDLDKDFLQVGVPLDQKIYSPTTCMFVKEEYNLRELNFRNNKDKLYNGYFGVKPRGKNFVAYSGKTIFGVYTIPEAAAYKYNIEMKKRYPDYPEELLNNVEPISDYDLVINYRA